MNPKIRWMTQTAVMLALLITLQAATKAAGQLVTGSCVNAILAVTVLAAGLSSGVTVAVISPVLAYLLGIAPQILTVPAIMAGNVTYVLLLYFIAGDDSKEIWRQIAAWLTAAAVKFGVLYALVSGLICGVFAPALTEAGLLKAPMLTALPATFSWPQLATALVGGALALTITPILRKALKR